MPNSHATKNADHVQAVSDAADKGGVEGALRQMFAHAKQKVAEINAMIDQAEADLPNILKGAAESGKK